jgi:arabinofuranosyltransferase
MTRRSASHLVYLAALIVVLVMRARLFHYVVDDAYISFRYARNLVRHGELVFNPGERVEGITNLLWTVALAVPEWLRWTTASFATWLGLACAAGLLVLTVAWGVARGRLTWMEAWLAALFLAALAPLPLWAQSGMETALFALLFVAVFAAGDDLSSPRRGMLAGLLAGIGFAVRPEAALAIVLVVALGLWPRATRAARVRPAALALAAFAVLAGAVTLFRALYYGALVPNTFAAKRTFLRLLLQEGAEYTFTFLWRYAAIPLGALVALAFVRGRPGQFLRDCARHPLVIAAAAYGLYVVQAGGDWMPFGRFFVPVLPLLLIAAAELAKSLGVDLARYRGRSLCLALLLLLVALESVGREQDWLAYNRDKLRPNLELCADALLDLDSRPTIALSVAGLVPYRTELPTIDLLGLNDRTIAHSDPLPYRSLPGHHKMAPHYVLDVRKPDLIFLNMGSCVSTQPLATLPPWDLEKFLTEDPSFSAHYELGFMSVRGRFVNVYMRRHPQ